MKRMMLWTLAGLTAAGTLLATATSCEKMENPKELTELWVLIAEGLLHEEADYTPETWSPFKAALTNAERVAGSKSPTLEAINAATTNLRNTMHALKKKETAARGEKSHAE